MSHPYPRVRSPAWILNDQINVPLPRNTQTNPRRLHLLTRVLPAPPLPPPRPGGGSEAGGTGPSLVQQQTQHGGGGWNRRKKWRSWWWVREPKRRREAQAGVSVICNGDIGIGFCNEFFGWPQASILLRDLDFSSIKRGCAAQASTLRKTDNTRSSATAPSTAASPVPSPGNIPSLHIEFSEVQLQGHFPREALLDFLQQT